MTTGEWFIVAGTTLQLVSIAVLVRWGYALVKRLTAKKAVTLRIHGVGITRGDDEILKQRVSHHGQAIEALQQAVRQLSEQTGQPGNLELISAGVLTVGTLFNLAGAVVLALQA